MFISKWLLFIIALVLLYFVNKIEKERDFFRSRLFTIFVLARKMEISSKYLPKEYKDLYLYKMRKYLDTITTGFSSELDWDYYHKDLELKTKAFQYAENSIVDDYSPGEMKVDDFINKITN